jgi:SAM-dependent methyltransferase
VRIVATDLNQPMVDFGSSKHTGGRSIEWKQADALSLPFQDGSFDAVACQFGAMFFPDRVRAYKEVLRVLRPDGHFFFNVWDRISANEFVQTVSEALASMFPDDPPRFMERTPHGYHDPARIREDLAAAGFARVDIETVDHVSKAASAQDAAVAYCQGNPLRTEIEARSPPSLEDATAQATAALESRYGKGPIEGRIRALVITAGRQASGA